MIFLLNKYDPFVIGIQETKFRSDHIPKLKNYNVHFHNRQSETVALGDVSIFVKENFDFIPCNIQSEPSFKLSPFKYF